MENKFVVLFYQILDESVLTYCETVAPPARRYVAQDHEIACGVFMGVIHVLGEKC